MDPEQWGPPLWNEMHTVTFEYPINPDQQDKYNIINYFRGIVHVLPCEKCRDHYQSELELYPVENFVNSKEELSRWLIDLHNRVNARLGKPHFPYEKAVEKYTKRERYTNVLIFALFLCFLILIILGKKNGQ